MSTSVRLTVDQYDRLIEANVFPPAPKRHRIELIEGELREMSPIGYWHERVVDVLTEWSFEALPRRAVRVRVQQSLGIPDLDSAPEPDLALVARRAYVRRPQAADVRLLVEVADSSLEYDSGEKADLYAGAGVADYWVVDIPNRRLCVYRQPLSGKYRSCLAFSAGDLVSPLAFPDILLRVSSLFEPDEGDSSGEPTIRTVGD